MQAPSRQCIHRTAPRPRVRPPPAWRASKRGEADGKPVNEFAFNDEAKDRAFAEAVIAQTHEQWKALIKNPDNEGKIDIGNTSDEAGPGFVKAEDADKVLSEASPFEANGPAVDFDCKNHFVAEMLQKA